MKPRKDDFTLMLDSIELTLGMNAFREILDKINLGKKAWVDLIEEQALSEFSKYYPNLAKYRCFPKQDYNRQQDMYFIDIRRLNQPNIEIINIKGLSSGSNNASMQQSSIGIPSGFQVVNNSGMMINSNGLTNISGGYDEQVLNYMIGETHASYLPRNMYLDFKPPNWFSITDRTHCDLLLARDFVDLDLQVSHSRTLNTIPKTALKSFEKLATNKVAQLLYNNLKYYDNLETGYGNVELLLNNLEDWSQRYDQIIEEIRDNYRIGSNRGINRVLII